MNQALNAYRNAAKAAPVTSRELESIVLLRAAAELTIAADALEAGQPDSVEKIASALQRNQRVWTVFLTSVTEEGRGLPEAFTNTIVRLGGYILNRCLAMLVAPDPSGMRALARLNREVAGGLSQSATLRE